MQTKVDRCFPHLGLHVAAFLQDKAYDGQEFMLKLEWREVAEEGRESLLQELKDHQVVIQVDVFDAFLDKHEEDLEADFWRLITPVDLAVHRIAPTWVKIMKLLLNFLDRGLSCRPVVREETGHQFNTENFKEWFGLFLLCLIQWFTVWKNDCWVNCVCYR